MIEFTKAYRTSDGSTYGTIEDAQKHEINRLLDDGERTEPLDFIPIVEWVVKNKDRLLDILTTKATSRPKARKINGGSKKRKEAAETTQATA
jgi:hypothetical protein